MSTAGRILVTVLSLVFVGEAPGQVVGRWLGQDGHDEVGHPTSVAPNGVQDIHVRLTGLPARNDIVFASITGHGADEWQFNRPKNPFAAQILRKPGTTTADLFLEPCRVETGREFQIKLTLDDRRMIDVYVKGGRADPNLRMKGTSLTVKSLGQTGEDLTGAGPGVGPDGFQDAVFALANVITSERVKSVDIAEPGGTKWSFGINAEGGNNAELVADPKIPNAAKLFLQPITSLAGKTLKFAVHYESGKEDVASVKCGQADPKRAMPTLKIPPIVERPFVVSWTTQETGATGTPGDVIFTVSGLPASKLQGAVLSDSVRGTWASRSDGRPAVEIPPEARKLTVSQEKGRVRFAFTPDRDESKTPMTLRLLFADGTSMVTTFEGGTCDLARRVPKIDPSESIAKPGDDLAALASRSGTVRLSPGIYALDQPLVLDKPVTIVGDRAAVLEFGQPGSAPPWTAAIKIHAGGTTLRGFSVRFRGPVRWREGVDFGPAVIGTTDNFDNRPDSPLHGLQFASLHVESPPARDASVWEEAPRLMRLRLATSGKIVGNTFRGGVVELFDGPWDIADNDYQGTPPGTYASSVFGIHDPHDVVIRGNHAKPVGPSGKTWRFLVMTNRGFRDVVTKNVIEAIGPRDDDTIPSMNSPEIILTESYHLRFEGKPSAVSPDGRVIAIASFRGEIPTTGDVVSVLTGAAAGQYRRVAQRIDSKTFLLDAPLPKGAGVIAIAPGFVGEQFTENTILARGGKAAAGIVLSGNHYGTLVARNRIVGAGDALQLMAAPSESPGIWGWSHAPYLGGLVEGNVIEDSERGGQLGVMHDHATKSNAGRRYMAVRLDGNTVRWSGPFLKRLGAKAPLTGMRLGYVRSLDPAEFAVEERNNRVESPPAALGAKAMRVEAAVVNGRAFTGKSLAWPVSPPKPGKTDGE